MPKLIVTEKGTNKQRVFEFNQEGITIGRSEENSVQLATPAVSRKHANIQVSGNNCFLVDLGSDNGTFLNGVKVPANEQRLLRNGDIIAIENYNLNFNMIDEMLASSFNEITDSDILEVKLLKKVLKAIDKERVPSIEVLNGNFVGKKFFLAEDVEDLIIGRDENCEFPIEEYVISRRHVKITKKNDEIKIQDLSSKNGTYINNRRVTEETLHDGDRIALGTIVLIFRNPKEVKLEDIEGHVKALKEKAEVEPARAEGEDLTGEGEGEGFEAFGEVPDTTPDDNYPVPLPRKERLSLNYFEMGMIGIGIVIFTFAVISFVNLIK